MMNDFIPVSDHYVAKNEKKYLIDCIETGWISSEGQYIKKIERDFSKYTGQKYGSCVSNGTAALELGVKVLKEEYGWEDDDEIIMPTFTIISCAQACIYNKLKPVFTDIDLNTWNMKTDEIEQYITSRTRAIMAVHIYGLPVDMTPLIDIAKKYDLKIIEDAAQAHGLRYKNKICGGMSDISTFSFYANKNITAGEGGMIMTSDENLIDKINYYKNLCHSADRFVHYDLGWNYRMSNLQAAVAYAQFEEIDSTIEKKKLLGKMYTERLLNLPMQLPKEKTEYAENNYWVYGVVLEKNSIHKAKEMMQRLKEQKIGTRPFFYPLNRQPIINRMGLSDGKPRPIAEGLYERGFYIPSSINLTETQIDIVANAIKNLF
jgi:perosamine synthetase